MEGRTTNPEAVLISDTLTDAVLEIRTYLDDDILGRAYEGDIRARIEALLAEMEAVRRVLDTPPTTDGPRYVDEAHHHPADVVERIRRFRDGLG